MMHYAPTEEQQSIIDHAGASFVTACPGAGKTRTMVERARQLLNNPLDRRGVAFLSFTNAAVDELEARLRTFGVLPAPLFPSFIATFDRFLWQFLIVPFGIPGCDQVPRLVPDKSKWEVKPYEKAQVLELRCFDRITGKADSDLAKEANFDIKKRKIEPYESQALSMIKKAWRQGQIDFEDMRAIVQQRLVDEDFAKRIGGALSARFREIIVDEAQDCNPLDLAIVSWLRSSGIALKLICDPNQSIYEFRGGVTDELEVFSLTFDEKARLVMSGNFRSAPAICKAIVALRPPALRSNPDKPLGRYKDDLTPVHILSYDGNGVSTKIGSAFQTLVTELDIPLVTAPVVASTRASACKAIGQPLIAQTKHLTLLLADATMRYHFAFALGNRRDALVGLHQVILQIQERIGSFGGYHNYLASNGLESGGWRPEVIALATELRFGSTDTADQWLGRARKLLAPGLVGASSINQRLKNNSELATALLSAPLSSCPARTIHSVKGLEFPAICVVMTAQTAGRILDVLEGKVVTSSDEEARKIYVAASRAERFLAIAIPKKQASRLHKLFNDSGSAVRLHQI
jgi:DNA helicase II / ATP-dependent DNA helicase PcrA